MAEPALATGPAPAPPAGPGPPAVLLEGLGRSYGEREVLRGVSLRLERGATLAVLGGNGAGKSTLLRVLATLLRPHEGRVEVLGSPLPAEARAVRGRVGYLGHDPMLYPELDPRENLRLHARLYGVPLARVDELLEAVGLDRRARDPVRELSRGMVQRVAAARAVLHEPELLLLDEPRAGLDPAAAALVEALVGPAPGRTRVLVTHDAGHALAEGGLVLGLRRGRPHLLTAGGQVSPSNIDALYA